MKPQIIKDAEDNWPEDEASQTAIAHKNRAADYPEDSQWLVDALAKDVAHMHRVFSFESDANELIARYDAALKEYLTA